MQSLITGGRHMDGVTRKAGIGFFRRLLGSQDDPHEPPPRTLQGARMLVVDDSPTICAILGKILGRDGYSVLKAGDGESALALARSEKPALIFLDIVLPGMNGFTVLRALRHDPLTADIPIVMISGNPQATEQFYVQRFGADDFMKKPFGREEVCERIGQLVTSGRLAARQAGVSAQVLPPELSAEELAGIPDIALPDHTDAAATVTVPAASGLSLHPVHGAG